MRTDIRKKNCTAFHVGIIHCPNIATNILKALVRKKQHVAEFCEPEGILRTREGMLQREFCEPEKGEFWVHVILRRLVPVVKKHMWLYEWRRNATSSYSSVCGYSFCSCHNYFFIVNAHNIHSYSYWKHLFNAPAQEILLLLTPS